ncbi:hypothetical protein [Sinosporangium album]|uniref:hypothetical protein n=1 Tax=Sinosporangium album TaxID=504805 RepID=UPI0015A12721|nr:hypothetical protein [Sinosporangium album]
MDPITSSHAPDEVERGAADSMDGILKGLTKPPKKRRKKASLCRCYMRIKQARRGG